MVQKVRGLCRKASRPHDSAPESLPNRGHFRAAIENSSNRLTEENLGTSGCLGWLDICALRTQDILPVLLDSRFHAPQHLQVGADVFLVRPTFDRIESRPLNVGSISEITPIYVAAHLGTRPGYSGSPVFTTNGDFVGLASKSNNYGIPTALLIRFLRLPSYKFMRTRVEIVPDTAIRRLAPCFEVGSAQITKCLNAQTDLLIDQLDYKLQAPGSKFQKSLYIDWLLKDFNEDFLAQLAVLDDSVAATNYRTLSAMRYVQPGATRRFNRLKGIKDDRLAKLCSVLVPFYLMDEADNVKDTIAIIANMNLCKSMATKTEPPDGFLTRWNDFKRSQLNYSW